MSVKPDSLERKVAKALGPFLSRGICVITLEGQDHKKGGVLSNKVQLTVVLSLAVIEQWYIVLIVNSCHYKRQ